MSNRGVSKGQQVVYVKAAQNGQWYTVSKHFNWDAAVASYNATATPKMIATRTKIAHKQFTDNGFVYNGKDPRSF